MFRVLGMYNFAVSLLQKRTIKMVQIFWDKDHIKINIQKGKENDNKS